MAQRGGGRRSILTCATCHQTAGIFICRGCSATFCLVHTNEHRERITKQMNELLREHEQLEAKMHDDPYGTSCEKIFQEIELWEQESISKIRQMAEQVRDDVSKNIRVKMDQSKEQCRQLANDLERARLNDEYFENDLLEWKDRLQVLTDLLQEQQGFELYEEKHSMPLIHSIRLRKTAMDNSGMSSEHANDQSMVEETNQYSSGLHDLRFRIEDFRPESTIRLGIISANNQDDPQITFYGWAEKDFVYIAGYPKENYQGYRTDFQTNDIVLLTINCTRERVSLTNERSGRTFHLDVNTHQCPFPWQPNIRLFHDSE